METVCCHCVLDVHIVSYSKLYSESQTTQSKSFLKGCNGQGQEDDLFRGLVGGPSFDSEGVIVPWQHSNAGDYNCGHDCVAVVVGDPNVAC